MIFTHYKIKHKTNNQKYIQEKTRNFFTTFSDKWSINKNNIKVGIFKPIYHNAITSILKSEFL